MTRITRIKHRSITILHFIRVIRVIRGLNSREWPMSTMTPTRSQVFSLPNQLTAARVVLAVILFGLISLEWWWWCLVVFALAALTDWLDGYFARLHNLTSSLGRSFDPLADKLLICGTYIFLLNVSGG